MILMLLKKKQYNSKKEHSHKTLVKKTSSTPANDIKEINELIRRVSKVRTRDFHNIQTEKIPSFDDNFEAKTKKDFIDQ